LQDFGGGDWRLCGREGVGLMGDETNVSLEVKMLI
jgi:hypothetical protein